jgi:hypothetical protein
MCVSHILCSVDSGKYNNIYDTDSRLRQHVIRTVNVPSVFDCEANLVSVLAVK